MMKSIATLLAFLIFTTSVFAGAPLGVSGLKQTSNLYPSVVQAPNNQVTNLGGGKALFENGNNNLLSNPSFEHATFNTGWTCTGLTPTAEATTVYHGKKALKLAASASTFECYQDSSINAAGVSGTQFLDYIRMLTAATGTSLKVCSRTNATTSTTNCVNVLDTSKPLNNGIYNLIKLPTNAGSTSTGISIAGVSVTGNIFLDDGFVGPIDLKVDGIRANIQTSYLSGAQAVAAGGAVTGALTTSFGSGVYSYNTGTGLYTALKAATISMSFSARTNAALTSLPSIIKNGSAIARSSTPNVANTWAEASAEFDVVAGDTFKAQNDDATTNFVVVSVEATEIVNSSTYSSTNADTDWVSYTPVITGTTNATGTASYKLVGSNIQIRGDITWSAAGAGATGVLFSMPSGVSLATLNSNVAGNGYFYQTTFQNVIVRADGAANAFYFSLQGSSNVIGTTPTGAASIGFTATFPVVGRTQSNIIIGQFNGLESCTDSYQCTDTFSAQISAAGVVSNENIDFISGNCTASVATISCTYKSGLAGNGQNLQSGMNCTATAQSTNYNQSEATATSTTSGFSFVTGAGGAASLIPITVKCQKGPSDYLGKTAKAVASDANVRSIGSVGVDVQTVYFGGSAGCASACTTGNCTICHQTGTKITGVTWVAAGQYNILGIDGQKYECGGSGTQTGGAAPYTPFLHERSSSSTTYARLLHSNGSTSLTDAGYASVTCTGVP